MNLWGLLGRSSLGPGPQPCQLLDSLGASPEMFLTTPHSLTQAAPRAHLMTPSIRHQQDPSHGWGPGVEEETVEKTQLTRDTISGNR